MRLSEREPALHDFALFLGTATRLVTPPLCPEIRLHLADDLDELWARQEDWLGHSGLAPPLWAIPWPGGQALARHILDHPGLVSGRCVLDFGSGSGICAIAAAKAGARSVEAAEIDLHARRVIAANALANGVTVAVIAEDLIGRPSCPWDVVLAADVWYERFMAGRLIPWLEHLSCEGANVLMGDRGRAFFRPAQAVEVALYRVPGAHGLERELVTETRIWTLGDA